MSVDTWQNIGLSVLLIAVLLQSLTLIAVAKWFHDGQAMAEGIIDNYAPLEPTHDGAGRMMIPFAPVEVTIGPCDCAEKYPESSQAVQE